MEAHDVDLSGDGSSTEDDPFSQVPEDPTLGTPTDPIDLSTAPDEERLGGTDDPPQEPAPGEYMEEPEEPEEPEDLTPQSHDDPLSTFDPPEEEPAEAPQSEELPLEDSEPDPEPEAAAEPDPEPDPVPDPPDPNEEVATPEAKGKSAVRNYVVLEKGDNEGWYIKTTVNSHNPEGAMRKAYRELYGNTPDVVANLVVVSENMWQPKPVRGRQKADLAIDIG